MKDSHTGALGHSWLSCGFGVCSQFGGSGGGGRGCASYMLVLMAMCMGSVGVCVDAAKISVYYFNTTHKQPFAGQRPPNNVINNQLTSQFLIFQLNLKGLRLVKPIDSCQWSSSWAQEHSALGRDECECAYT